MSVSEVNTGVSVAKLAVAKAKQEIADEVLKKGVEKYKLKLREEAAAKVALANIQRELADLEAAIEQGNI